MARKKVTLITGANGEVGHGLIKQLYEMPQALPVVALDLRNLDEIILPWVEIAIAGDILDQDVLNRLTSEYEFDVIYHLAALLSTHSEFRPEAAHRVNVQGTVNLLQLASEQSHWRNKPVKFIYPSSVAVYGMPDLTTKAAAPPRDDFLEDRLFVQFDPPPQVDIEVLERHGEQVRAMQPAQCPQGGIARAAVANTGKVRVEIHDST